MVLYPELICPDNIPFRAFAEITIATNDVLILIAEASITIDEALIIIQNALIAINYQAIIMDAFNKMDNNQTEITEFVSYK